MKSLIKNRSLEEKIIDLNSNVELLENEKTYC